jgi:hypothetical protein
MSDSTAKPLMLQAAGRAFLKVGLKYNDQQMLASAQRLLEEAQRRHLEAQTKALEQSSTDIVLELRTLARLATFGEQDAAHLRAAADEIERLPRTLAHEDALLEGAVAAERAAAVAMIEAFADEQLVGRRAADHIAAAIKARRDSAPG